MIALLDLDIYAYRCGWSSNEDPVQIAMVRLDEMIDNTLVETKADEYKGWLSDNKANNFRFKLDPSYKANREHQERPVHLEALKEYLIEKWGATFAYGMEADDALGIAQDKRYVEFMYNPMATVICSIDKDLLTIPGHHFNFVKKEFSFVTPEEGLRNFYRQLVTGDVADNIRGVHGIGPKKSDKLLRGLSLESDMFDAVFGAYKSSDMGWDEEQIRTHLLRAGRLLKIRQQEDEPLWELPTSNSNDLDQTVDKSVSSTPMMPKESGLFMEPTTLGKTGDGVQLNGQLRDIESPKTDQACST